MRGKRSKQYRRLMSQYGLTFNFREPYQVLVDAQMIQDADRFKMGLVAGLERTLHGKVKPMITQCSIRHLYKMPSISHVQKDALVAVARSMERRRCNHHTLEEPLSTLECLSNVIDPKNSKTNKNCYVVASQDEEVRRYCRGVKGVPLVYVKRSVMIMEPMADSSVGVREGIERGKFRSGLRGRTQAVGVKRKREGSSEKELDVTQGAKEMIGNAGVGEEKLPKKKRARGLKGPNPLSIKKSRKEKEGEDRISKSEDNPEGLAPPKAIEGKAPQPGVSIGNIIEGPLTESHKPLVKRKRKRKHKTASFRDAMENDSKNHEAAE